MPHLSRPVVLPLLAVGLIAADAPTPVPSTTQPTTAIAALEMAYRLKQVDSPANSALDYRGPPYPPAWHRMAKIAYEQNAPMRAAIRQARALPPGRWPVFGDAEDATQPQLGPTRTLVVELRDAALYALHVGRQNEALDFLDDIAFLSDITRGEPETAGGLIRLAVATGFDYVLMYGVLEISPALDLSTTAPDPIPPQRVSALINRLLKAEPTSAQRARLLETQRKQAVRPATSPDAEATLREVRDEPRFIIWATRIDMERRFAAMSLACQLYRAENSVWPESAEMLVPTYLHALPLDPFADPPAPIGYRLEPNGLPDGNDRPVVFSKCESEDGLAHTAHGPLSGYYVGDGDPNPLPITERKRLGQFRDVAAWPAR